jgi:hypothetical protein
MLPWASFSPSIKTFTETCVHGDVVGTPEWSGVPDWISAFTRYCWPCGITEQVTCAPFWPFTTYPLAAALAFTYGWSFAVAGAFVQWGPGGHWSVLVLCVDEAHWSESAACGGAALESPHAGIDARSPTSATPPR